MASNNHDRGRAADVGARTALGAYLLCQAMGIEDAQMRVSLFEGQPTPLRLIVKRWSPPSSGAAQRVAPPPGAGPADSRNVADLREGVAAGLVELTRCCSLEVGGTAFDFGYGSGSLTIRRGVVVRMAFSRQIRLRDFPDLARFDASHRTAARRPPGRAPQDRRAGLPPRELPGDH
jgi:hypothetical protein